jgi:hypothetical protein
MCAEAVPWRCHRQLISDVLVARGHEVRHITSGRGAEAPRAERDGPLSTARAVVTYPGSGAAAAGALRLALAAGRGPVGSTHHRGGPVAVERRARPPTEPGRPPVASSTRSRTCRPTSASVTSPSPSSSPAPPRPSSRTWVNTPWPPPHSGPFTRRLRPRRAGEDQQPARLHVQRPGERFGDDVRVHPPAVLLLDHPGPVHVGQHHHLVRPGPGGGRPGCSPAPARSPAAGRARRPWNGSRGASPGPARAPRGRRGRGRRCPGPSPG